MLITMYSPYLEVNLNKSFKKFMRSSQNMNRIFDGIKELLSFIFKGDDGTRVVYLKYSLYLFCFRDTTKFFMDDIMDCFPVGGEGEND